MEEPDTKQIVEINAIPVNVVPSGQIRIECSLPFSLLTNFKPHREIN